MEIDQAPDPDYDSVKIDYVGFVDPYALEGMVVLKADNGKEFHMRAFSGEVAKHISSFDESDDEQSPSIYRMIEEICEQNAIFFNPKDEEDLVYKLENAMLDSSKLKNFCIKNYTISKNFTWDKTCKETLNIYKKLI